MVAATHRKPADRLESRELTVLVMIVLLLVFVAMIVVPIQIAEEIETGTLGALRLAAPGAEILAAKALAGFLYGLAGVGLTVLLTQIHVHNPLQLFAAAFALSASLVGFGLMMGLLWPNSAAINTYAGFLALPLIGLAAAALFIDPGVFATILNLLPFPQATKLLADGLSPHPIPRRPGLMGSDRDMGAARLPHPRADRVTPRDLAGPSQPNLMDTRRSPQNGSLISTRPTCSGPCHQAHFRKNSSCSSRCPLVTRSNRPRNPSARPPGSNS